MLVVDDKQALIIDVSAYQRKSDERGLYKPMYEMEVGRVYCPRLIRAILICIVTGRGRTVGSHVRIDDIELDGTRYKGPGLVASALGIDVANTQGWAKKVGELVVEVELDTQQGRTRRKTVQKKQPWYESALGKSGLARLMPQIVDRYLAGDPAISFEGYLNALLRECRTETELRRRIS